jgi:hypothetical protein
MANTIDQDLMTEIVALSGVTGKIGSTSSRIHYNHIPESYEGTYIFFRRSTAGDDDDRSLGDASGRKYRFREFFDVEAISRDLGDEVDLALLLKKLDSHQGTLGDGTIQGLFVRDHSDDYIPKGVESDAGYFIGSLEIEVVGYSEGA